jgi:hypothetical protein
MNDPTSVLQALHQMPPIGSKQTQKPFDRRAGRASLWLMLSAAALFFVLCILAAWHIWLSPLEGIWRSIALLSGLGAMVLPFLSMVIEVLSALVIIIRFKRDSLDYLLLNIQHDSNHIERLMSFDKGALESAQIWLQLQTTRIRNRIGIFFGSPDKIAVFSLAGMGWVVWKEFSAQQGSGLSKQAMVDWGGLHNLFIYGVSLLAGLALGAVLMNYRLQRYTYQLELLALTIARKSKSFNGLSDSTQRSRRIL